jgi:hypothetical protein
MVIDDTSPDNFLWSIQLLGEARLSAVGGELLVVSVPLAR